MSANLNYKTALNEININNIYGGENYQMSGYFVSKGIKDNDYNAAYHFCMNSRASLFVVKEGMNLAQLLKDFNLTHGQKIWTPFYKSKFTNRILDLYMLGPVENTKYDSIIFPPEITESLTADQGIALTSDGGVLQYVIVERSSKLNMATLCIEPVTFPRRSNQLLTLRLMRDTLLQDVVDLDKVLTAEKNHIDRFMLKMPTAELKQDTAEHRIASNQLQIEEEITDLSKHIPIIKSTFLNLIDSSDLVQIHTRHTAFLAKMYQISAKASNMLRFPITLLRPEWIPLLKAKTEIVLYTVKNSKNKFVLELTNRDDAKGSADPFPPGNPSNTDPAENDIPDPVGPPRPEPDTPLFAPTRRTVSSTTTSLPIKNNATMWTWMQNSTFKDWLLTFNKDSFSDYKNTKLWYLFLANSLPLISFWSMLIGSIAFLNFFVNFAVFCKWICCRNGRMRPGMKRTFQKMQVMKKDPLPLPMVSRVKIYEPDISRKIKKVTYQKKDLEIEAPTLDEEEVSYEFVALEDVPLRRRASLLSQY
jgi:hypothetical protein